MEVCPYEMDILHLKNWCGGFEKRIADLENAKVENLVSNNIDYKSALRAVEKYCQSGCNHESCRVLAFKTWLKRNLER